MASSRPRASSLLRPGEHYDDTGKLCAPPSTVDSRDFYVRAREEGGGGTAAAAAGGAGVGGGGARSVSTGAGAGMGMGGGGRRGSGAKEKEDKPLPLVVRYLPLDLWFCTSIMMDSTLEETTFHLLSVAGLLPPQPYRHDLVPSFDSLPKLAPKSVFDLLARNHPESVVVSESYGSGFEGRSPGISQAGGSSSKSAGSLARPKSTDVAGLGAGVGKGKESGWNKFQHIIRPSISSSNLRSTFSSSSAHQTNSLASTPTSSTSALVPQSHPPLSYPALPNPLHPHPSSSSISLPSSPTPIPSPYPSQAAPNPSSSVTTTSSLLSDLSFTSSSDGGLDQSSWSIIGSPSPFSSPRSRSRTDSQAAASVHSLSTVEASSRSSTSSLPKVKFAPPPPGIVVDKSISPTNTEAPLVPGLRGAGMRTAPAARTAGGGGEGTTTTTKSTTMTRKGKVVISSAAATRRYNLDHETDRVLGGHDLVCFGTGFLLDKFSIKSLRPNEIVEIQLRDAYIPLPRSNPEHYLRPCFQSWVFLSSVVGGSTKHSSSSGGAGRENESLTFKRRWLKVEGGEVKAWKSIEEGLHSSVPVAQYPITALISLDEFDAPKVNSKSLQTIPAKSILARFSERTEGGVKVETGRIWIRSQSQRAHESLLRCLTFASPWSARTQISLSPNFDRRQLYLEARNILTQPSWRLKKSGYFAEVEARHPREFLEWETWVFTRFDWNASGESSARNSISTRRMETISHGEPPPGHNVLRNKVFPGEGTAEESNLAPRLSAAPLGTRRTTNPTNSNSSSTTPLSLSRTISNLEITSTASLNTLSSTKSKHSCPSVIAETFSGLVLATATLGRSRSSSSANGKGHRRSLTASSSHEVFSAIDRKNIVEPRSPPPPPPIKTAVDASGEEVFLIGGDETETDPSPQSSLQETAAQWSRRMGSRAGDEEEGAGMGTIKSRASSQASSERRTTSPPGTLSSMFGASVAAEDVNHRRRQIVTASHFQTPTPFSRSSFASVSSVASTSATSLDTPGDFPQQARPSSSSSSGTNQPSSTTRKKSPSRTPTTSSKNSSPPRLPPPRTSSIPIPSIPQHRRHDSSTLQSILSTSPRTTLHSPLPARSLTAPSMTSSSTPPNRKSSLLPPLGVAPSAYTPPPSIHSPSSLFPPVIPKRVDSSPTNPTSRLDVSFGAAILTGGPRINSVEDLSLSSLNSSPHSSARSSSRGRRQSEGSSSSSSSTSGRRKSAAAQEEEKAAFEGDGDEGRVKEGETFALMGSSKGRLMKERSLSTRGRGGEAGAGGGIRRKAVDYGPLGEL